MIKTILRFLVEAPVYWKGNLLHRVGNRLLTNARNRPGLLKGVYAESNLGIKGSVKVRLPLDIAPGFMLFGKPRTYGGEFHSLRLCQWLLNDAACFVDIGANWGYYTYFMSAQSEKPIFWFEPNPDLFRSIEGNTSRMSRPGIIGSRQAIGDEDGELTFYINKNSDLESTLVAPADDVRYEKVTVQSLRFSTWHTLQGHPQRMLVKVDVENAEWKFIEGAKDSMDSIEYLVMEVLGPARQSGFVDYMIRELGMNAYYINGNRLEKVDHEDNRYTAGEYNWLFCKADPLKLGQVISGSGFMLIA